MSNYQFESPYFAAVDLGSNSFHMLIVRINESKIEIVDREKEMVQIARGIQQDGTLDTDAVERAMHCLTRFSERLRDIPVAQIRAVGTKTLRSIKHANRFIHQAEEALGANIQTISGYEEARLVYHGLANTVVNDKEQRLVVDIGGGSTEFVIGKGYEPDLLESLPLGCVTFSQRFFRRNGITSQSMRSAYLAACSELEEIRKTYLLKSWDMSFGTSGTMKAIAKLTSHNDGGVLITRDSLSELYHRIIDETCLAQVDLPKLRKEVLPAGVAILKAVFDEFNLDTLHVADATLKEGLIYDNIGRFSDHDVRQKTVQKLKSQNHIDIEQAKRVAQTALNLRKQIKGPNLPGVSRSKTLEWAAQLHEIGINISHSGYHRHSFYLLRHSDLAGFGRYEQYILANLVRYHRRKIDPATFEDLSKQTQKGFAPLLVCLRLSVLLHRRRESLDAQVNLSYDQENCYCLEFKNNYLESNPMTKAGLDKEISLLKQVGIELSYQKTCGSC